MKIPTALKLCPLFSGIDETKLVSILGCIGAQMRSYRKDEFVFLAGDKATGVGVVLSGGVRILQEDFQGGRAILAHVAPGEVFGEAFPFLSNPVLRVSVAASEASEIMTLNYQKIVTGCSSACGFRIQLFMNMLQILAEKSVQLTEKLEHLSKRTTREKVLSFLSMQALLAKSATVTIPFNKTELAEYLCVDRSALARELKTMRDEGVLQYNRNVFELPQANSGLSLWQETNIV